LCRRVGACGCAETWGSTAVGPLGDSLLSVTSDTYLARCSAPNTRWLLQQGRFAGSSLRNSSSATGAAPPLNRVSRTITEPKSQGASQAMLIATGLKPEELSKPQIGADTCGATVRAC
jgi:hypothetical protein